MTLLLLGGKWGSRGAFPGDYPLAESRRRKYLLKDSETFGSRKIFRLARLWDWF